MSRTCGAFLLALVAGAATAAACECGTIDDVPQALAASRAVFVGRVVDRGEAAAPWIRWWFGMRGWLAEQSDLFDAPPFAPRRFGQVFTFAIERVWKDPLVSGRATRSGTRVDLVTGRGYGDCGYPFRLGETYLVYVHPSAIDSWDASLCSRTRPLASAAADLAALGEPEVASPGVIEPIGPAAE